MALINTVLPTPDANDGVLTRNPERVGNRRWGTKVFLSGTEQVLEVAQRASRFVASQNALSTTAEEILDVRETRIGAVVHNTDTAITVYVGPQTVTSSNGFPLAPGASLSVSVTGALWAVAASGTPTIAIFEEFN